MFRRGLDLKTLVVPQLDVPELVVPLLSLDIFDVFVCDVCGFLRLLQGSAGAVTRLPGYHGNRPVTSKILIFW